jgi:hypothetical protein
MDIAAYVIQGWMNSITVHAADQRIRQRKKNLAVDALVITAVFIFGES